MVLRHQKCKTFVKHFYWLISQKNFFSLWSWNFVRNEKRYKKHFYAFNVSMIFVPVQSQFFFFFFFLMEFLSRYFKCRWMADQSWSIAEDLFVTFLLVFSNSQYCHMKINVYLCCVIIISIQLMPIFAFSLAELRINVVTY